MNPSAPQRDPVEQLAEEFADRLRRGEHPSLTEYAERHPELASAIRDLFPALVMMEQFGSVAGPLTGPSPEPVGTPEGPPRTLGDYRIIREVGRGGMGVVYEAVQESLGRHVALKVLPAGVRGAGPFRERFRREARAAARLHHTNVVPVFGVGEAGGTLFYAMQFIRGQGLDVVLAEVRRLRNRPSAVPDGPAPTESRPPSVAEGLLTGHFECGPPGAGPSAGPFPAAASLGLEASTASHSCLANQPEARYFREVARIGAQAGDALDYAHGQGILHRDVKPSNLLLDTQGILWVADFGLAKADDSEDLTGAGDIVGTLRYMAPERFRGISDARSDTYALGVTLYEMLTLRPAVNDTDRLKLIDRIAGERPAAPRTLDPRIPHDLETVVLKAMAKEPADRYQRASDFADDLRRFLADRPVHARRHSVAERFSRWCRRNPMVAALVASVLMLTLLLAVGSTVAAGLLRIERDKLRQSLGDLETAERGRSLQLFNAYIAQARAGRGSGRPGRRIDSLNALASAAQLASGLDLPAGRRLELRNETIACLPLLDVRIGSPIEPPTGFTYGLDLDAACEHVAASDSRGSICVYRAADGCEVARLGGFGQGGRFSYFSPDGRHLCVCDLVAGA
ncbi:MAG TPA: serine/threonine-protein kinase, partial [Gemmataceae bacterium]|nr:serine/threonine-protein kinase [Gemmataceae bacterium]